MRRAKRIFPPLWRPSLAAVLETLLFSFDWSRWLRDRGILTLLWASAVIPTIRPEIKGRSRQGFLFQADFYHLLGVLVFNWLARALAMVPAKYSSALAETVAYLL
jgi:hypothetical protein